MNARVWSFRQPDFPLVTDCHATAQVALYDQVMWDKYRLTRLAGDAFETNTLLISEPAEGAAATDWRLTSLSGTRCDHVGAMPILPQG